MKVILASVVSCCVMAALAAGAVDETAVESKAGNTSGEVNVGTKKVHGSGDGSHVKPHQAKINKYDIDGDGKLSEAERAAAKKAMLDKRVGEFFTKFDTNADGCISKEELTLAWTERRDQKTSDGNKGERRKNEEKRKKGHSGDKKVKK